MIMLSKLDIVQVKSLYCAGNKLRCTFFQCSSAVKNILFHANTVYAGQLWSKYTDTSLKRLRIAYNNVYRIMQYVLRNVSVLAHTKLTLSQDFDVLFRNNVCGFVKQCASSSNFFIRIFTSNFMLHMSNAFYKYSFFHNY